MIIFLPSRSVTQRICIIRSNRESNHLSGGPWPAKEKGFARPTWNCGQLDFAPWQRTLRGALSVREFWPLNKFPFSHSHPSPQIWLPVTFSFSRILKIAWKVTISVQLITSREPRRRYWMGSRKKTSSATSWSGGTAGSGVWLPKELTSKETTFSYR
jgi:hypothetical protein